MKKVVILAYDFPPYVSVGGLRPYSWYKYLKNYDIYPIVITRQWSNKYGNKLDYIAAGQSDTDIIEETEFGTIIRTSYKPNLSNRLLLKYGETKYIFFRKLISAYFEFAQWIYNVGSKVNIFFAANNYLKHNKVDAIIATGEPFILFKYASKLSKSYNIPWIADYRDPWLQDHTCKKNMLTLIWQKLWEKNILKNAKCITTVSDYFINKINTNIKSKDFHILINGYDSDNIEHTREIEQNNSVFTIAFTGTILDCYPFESFLSCLSQFINETKNLKIQFNLYGINNEHTVKELIANKYHTISQYINITPKLDNLLVLQKLKEANVLLLFNYYSIIGTKIYDYVGINRKILLCYSNDIEAIELKKKYYYSDKDSDNDKVQENLITDTNSGVVIENKKQLLETLKNLYSEFEKNGFIACNSRNTEQFSRKLQTEKLAKIIKDITK